LIEDHIISLYYHQTEIHSTTSEETYTVGLAYADPGTWAVSVAMKSSFMLKIIKPHIFSMIVDVIKILTVLLIIK